MGKTTDTYVTRIQDLATSCDCGSVKGEIIRDQVIEKCISLPPKRRLLRKLNLTLLSLQVISRTIERFALQVFRLFYA